MTATIRQVSTGKPKTVRHGDKDIETGIFKTPVAGRVEVTLAGIVGDGQADLSVHGGRDKAVYVYPERHYDTWSRELGVSKLQPAQFGENFTVSELAEDSVAIGDRFRFGSVVAIVSQPRLPCFKLGIRMQDESFPQRFLASGRLGFYLRVEDEGETVTGDDFERVERAQHDITVTRLWEVVFGGNRDADEARRCLELLPHLDAGWQRRLRAIAGIAR